METTSLDTAHEELMDADGDGWSEAEDCNDADSRAFPGNPEVCDDGVDNDCNGYRDEWDQACLPEEGCAVSMPAPQDWGGGLLLVALAYLQRRRRGPSSDARYE